MDNPIRALRLANLRWLYHHGDLPTRILAMAAFLRELRVEVLVGKGDLRAVRYPEAGEEQAERLRDARLLPLDAEGGMA